MMLTGILLHTLLNSIHGSAGMPGNDVWCIPKITKVCTPVGYGVTADISAFIRLPSYLMRASSGFDSPDPNVW